MLESDTQSLMLYWGPKTATDVLKRERVLDHVASNQLRRASNGDVIWVVTVDRGELFLLGKLTVDIVTTRQAAISSLRRADVWGDLKYYAIAARGREEPLKRISLKAEAEKIGFISLSNKRTRLAIDDRHGTNPQQLQTMRILNNTSAQLLDYLWKQR